MAKYQNLINSISSVIRTNGNNEITGQILQDVLKSIVNVVGANPTYGGVAHPADNPGTPEGGVVYIASDEGTYVNFGGLTLASNELAVLVWDGTSWSKESVTYIEDLGDIEEAKQEALDAIAEAIQGLNIYYDIETDKGAVKDVQLKDGDGNKLIPKTDAEVVNVQFNAQTKNLSDRLKEMSFIKKLNIDEGLSTIGYISTSDKWTENTYNVGTLFDVSDYVGMKVIVQKNAEIANVRIAFLQNFIPTSGEYAKYAAGIGMIVQTDNEPVSYTIPHDCKYIYTLKRVDNHDMQPPYITIYDGSDPLSTAHLHTKAKGNVVYKILKSFYPKMMQKGNGFVNNKDYNYGRFTRDTNYCGIFISMADYRGKIIRVIPSTIFARVAFVTSAPSESTSTSILCANTRVLETTGTMILVVPQDCNFLYVFQYSADYGYNFTERIDILEIDYDSIISDFVKIENDKIIGDEEEMSFGNTKVAKVFSHYFPNITSDYELNGLDTATISSDGITLPAGVESKITHNKLFVFDDEKITLDVTASDTDKILMYCANSNIGNLSTSDVESYVLFDFTEGKISIYRAGTISTSTGLGTVLQSILFTASSGKFRLTIGRNRRNVFASVYNYSDRTEVSVTADESMFMETNYQIRPAGWMYRYPAFMTLAGTPVYKSFSGYAKTDLYMLFQGDSYTQGYAGLYKKSWSYQSANYFKNSRTCGISGCKLSDLIEQYHDCIKGKINVKVMVISIGINDMSDLTSDTLITSWASTFKSYCDELVADGITPIVNRIWPEGSASTATATKAKKMNDAIRSLGYDGADFGAVTGYPNNAKYYTQSHLSPDGNDLTFKIFINEMSMYKQD